MDRIEPTRALAFKIWWALTWRVGLGALAFAVAVGVLFAALNLLGMPKEIFDVLIPIVGFAAGVGIWVEVIFRVLQKRFKDFEIALITPQE